MKTSYRLGPRRESTTEPSSCEETLLAPGPLVRPDVYIHTQEERLL